jgi:hypothetical protein
MDESWNNDPREWLYWRMLVADGNFVAVHQVQPRSVDDVWLKDGQSFMTATDRYRQHIACTMERPEVRKEISLLIGLIIPRKPSDFSPVLVMRIMQSSIDPSATRVVMYPVLELWHV